MSWNLGYSNFKAIPGQMASQMLQKNHHDTTYSHSINMNNRSYQRRRVKLQSCFVVDLIVSNFVKRTPTT